MKERPNCIATAIDISKKALNIAKFNAKMHHIENKINFINIDIDKIQVNKYDFVIQMDADFSHRIIDLLNLFKYKEKYGLVLGSRYVEGGKTEGWNKKRKTLSKYANKISTFLISSPVKDMTSGFRVYTNEALKKIDKE